MTAGLLEDGRDRPAVLVERPVAIEIPPVGDDLPRRVVGLPGAQDDLGTDGRLARIEDDHRRGRFGLGHVHRGGRPRHGTVVVRHRQGNLMVAGGLEPPVRLRAVGVGLPVAGEVPVIGDDLAVWIVGLPGGEEDAVAHRRVLGLVVDGGSRGVVLDDLDDDFGGVSGPVVVFDGEAHDVFAGLLEPMVDLDAVLVRHAVAVEVPPIGHDLAVGVVGLVPAEDHAVADTGVVRLVDDEGPRRLVLGDLDRPFLRGGRPVVVRHGQRDHVRPRFVVDEPDLDPGGVRGPVAVEVPGVARDLAVLVAALVGGEDDFLTRCRVFGTVSEPGDRRLVLGGGDGRDGDGDRARDEQERDGRSPPGAAGFSHG